MVIFVPYISLAYSCSREAVKQPPPFAHVGDQPMNPPPVASRCLTAAGLHPGIRQDLLLGCATLGICVLLAAGPLTASRSSTSIASPSSDLSPVVRDAWTPALAAAASLRSSAGAENASMRTFGNAWSADGICSARHL